MIQQQDDLSSLSDEELARIAGVTLQPRQGGGQRQPQAQRPSYSGPLPQRAEDLFPALIQQESGGRAGVVGPDTRWGNAIGRTQMLPATAREVSQRLGLPYREDLLRGTSPEAAQYQDRLGLAYLQEGFERTGNARDALHYYHGGPDRSLWGPKTRAYADSILSMSSRGEGVQPSYGDAQFTSAPMDDDLESLSDEELAQLAGVELTPATEPQEVVIDQGVMKRGDRAFIGDRDLGPWDTYWAERGRPELASPGYLAALEQEAQTQDFRNANGYGVGFVDQFTAPINDEIAGVAGYLSQGATNLGRRLTGQPLEISAAERGRAAMNVQRGQQEQYAQENPVASAAGNILGGFAFAPGRALGAAGAAGNFLRPTIGQAYRGAAATGAAYGASDATGDLTDRAIGGGVGAGLGLATAGLVDGATRLIPGRVPWNQQMPVSRNENRIGAVLDRELRRAGMNRTDLSSALSAAPEGALPLNLSEGLLAPAAEAVAQSPGPGARIIRDAIQEQQRGTGARFRSRVGEGMGGEGNYFATLDNAIQTRRTEADRVISSIEGQTYRPNENAISALRSPYAREALTEQVALRAGSPDPAIRASAERLRGVVDALGRDVSPNVALDIRTSQEVSRALLDASSQAWSAGNAGRGQLFRDIGRAVRDDARDQVKPYGEWLKRYGDDSSNIEALELGRTIFRNADDARPDGNSAELLRRQFNEMSDTGKDMFRKGVGEAIIARAQTGQGDLGAMRSILRSGEFADRIKVAFPDERAFTRFLNAAEAEVQMANQGNAILNGSPTARRQALQRDLGAQNYGDQAQGLTNASLTGLAAEGARQTIRGIGNAIGRNRSIINNDQLNEALAMAVTDRDVLQRLLMRPQRRGLIGGRAPAGVAGSSAALVL